MPQMRHYRNGALFGIEYLFSGPDDGLRMHRHVPAEEHNVVVLTGEVLVYGPNGTRLVRAHAGDVVDIDGRLLHEVRAIEPGTRTLNLFLNGEPAAYRALSASDRAGQFDMKLTHSYRGGVLTMLPEWSEVLKDG